MANKNKKLTTPAVPDRGELIVYKAEDGKTAIDVRLAGETVWLSQAQMVDLFQRDQAVISRHVRNIFKSKELDEKSNMHFLHIASSDRPVAVYNLDVIIGVGYRVNSERGTQFRIWATHTLKDYLLKGYALNERKLHERGFVEIEQTLQLLSKTLDKNALISDEGRAVLDIVRHYARSFVLLRQYDENQLPTPAGQKTFDFVLSEDSARESIVTLKSELHSRGEASELFGQERDRALSGILGAVEQTFDGKNLYPSIEAKAAHLIYFVIKDHPFNDGNKRIGTFLFLYYLQQNGCLIAKDGSFRFDERTLVALALLIAESEPTNKELMIRLVMNLLTPA